MTDSFSSLLDLVDSHLSQTKIKPSDTEDGMNSFDYQFNISFNSLQQRLNTNTQSETLVSGSQDQIAESTSLNLPFQSYNSPTQKVLNQQVANMIKAKELKKLQEAEKLPNEMQKLKLENKTDEYFIDLSKGVITPSKWPPPQPPSPEDILSRSSSFGALFNTQYYTDDEVVAEEKKQNDAEFFSYKNEIAKILSYDVKGKCSSAGKVLCARLKAVAAPYVREKRPTNIKRFDFSTMSPCDIIKQNLNKKPNRNNITYCEMIWQQILAEDSN